LNVLTVELDKNRKVEAIAPVYEGSNIINKELDEIAESALLAKGSDGNCIDYILNIQMQLNELNIVDLEVNGFAELVKEKVNKRDIKHYIKQLKELKNEADMLYSPDNHRRELGYLHEQVIDLIKRLRERNLVPSQLTYGWGMLVTENTDARMSQKYKAKSTARSAFNNGKRMLLSDLDEIIRGLEHPRE